MKESLLLGKKKGRKRQRQIDKKKYDFLKMEEE